MKQRGHFIVSGRVQGVCYRMFAVEEAERLGFVGWVRNMPDGRVEIVAEGEESDFEDFLEACRMGPAMAAVSDIKAEYSEARGEFRSFAIRY